MGADNDFEDFVADAPPDATKQQSPFTPVPGGARIDPAAEPTGRPYTKWYRLDERYTLADFRIEGYILGIIAVLFVFHIFGSRSNRSKARAWMKAHASLLRSEFALVGFGGVPSLGAPDEKDDGASLLKEKSLFEFETYASGRKNIAFLDVNLNLTKRFNPILNGVETLLGFFWESFGQPQDVVEATLYPFDGKETRTVPMIPGSELKVDKSTYDGFVWAIVNKERMQRVREDRYDVSMTFTKDHPKLPVWLTAMSESAEITDALLTAELADAVTKAGDLFEYIIVSDQPMDKPTTIDETTPRKRIFLKYRLPSNNDYTDLIPLFAYFLRLPDRLVKDAHFRPEVLRKVRNIREETIAQIKKADEESKAEERNLELQRAKKAKRDEQLKGMDAKAQKKFLEKEKEKEMKKQQKKSTMRG